MTDHEPAADETAALRARISALSAASLRISASLDLEMVLNEVVESARALTGARYGAIATIDEAGAPQDFVTSGFTADEHRHIVASVSVTVLPLTDTADTAGVVPVGRRGILPARRRPHPAGPSGPAPPLPSAGFVPLNARRLQPVRRTVLRRLH